MKKEITTKTKKEIYPRTSPAVAGRCGVPLHGTPFGKKPWL